MTAIPSNLARLPNMLRSQIMLSTLQSTQQRLLNTQIQLATGRRVNRPSDDALAAGTISVLDDIVERREQWLRNLSHAESVLGNLDAAFVEAVDDLPDPLGAQADRLGDLPVAESASREQNDPRSPAVDRVGQLPFQPVQLPAFMRSQPPCHDLVHFGLRSLFWYPNRPAA